MSSWTYINGVVEVSPFGRTQAECRYILETVLAHLPKVTGSEEDMYTHVIQCGGHNSSADCDEFGVRQKYDNWIEIQDNYLVVIEGHFRDRDIETTHREFMKWIMRLVKRIKVSSCFVSITDGWDKKIVVDLDGLEVYETPWTWEGKGTVNWCEYLVWQYPRIKGKYLERKPDFVDGKCLELMPEREKSERLPIKKRKRKRYK